MSKWTRRTFYSSMLGLALTLAGLLNLTILDRALVQPDFEPYASHIVEARGWPLAWLVTEPSNGERPLEATERFLVGRFLMCWIGATLLSMGLITAVTRLN